MSTANKKSVKSATESLQEMLRRIGPFLPKPPKPEPKEHKTWETISEGTFPPMPIPKCKNCDKKP
jgi:hypothetical protein